MSIGLDLGSTDFRSLRIVDKELVGRQCRAVYVVLTDTVSHRRLLQQAGTTFASCGDDLVLFGNSAIEWADILNLPAIALLPGGRIPQSDAVARQIVTLMIDAVLPPAEQPGAVCCLTVPGGHDIDQDELPYDVRFFQQLVALRGYQPQLISPGLAVVLAELESASFSGIGIRFGAGDCQIGVIHCGRELAGFSFDDCQVDQCEESVPPKDAVAGHELELARALAETLTAARDELSRLDATRWLAQPTQVVCTGGPTNQSGFPRLFAQVWSDLEWPMKVGTLRVASDPIYSIARGCLIQSRLENRDDRQRAA